MKSSGEPLQDLRKTPTWRWLLYMIAFGAAVLFLGLKFDSKLLWILPVAILFVGVWLVGILHLFIYSNRFRAGYLWLLRIGIVIIWAMVLFRAIDLVKHLCIDGVVEGIK